MHQSPIVSAVDLALYMVSSSTAQMEILKRAKYQSAPSVDRFEDVRHHIVSYLLDPDKDVSRLAGAEQSLRQKATGQSEALPAKDEADKPIQALHALRGMTSSLSDLDFAGAPEKQANLAISGVEISVQADALVLGSNKMGELIGAALLQMPLEDADMPATMAKKRDMGRFVATLVRMHVEENIPSDRTPVNQLCLSIDLQNGEVVRSPISISRRIKELASACHMISAVWPTV